MKNYILIFCLLFLTSCGSAHTYLISAESGRSGIENIGINVVPQNRYEISQTIAPVNVPLIPEKGRGFQSYYYFEKPGLYSKPLKNGPDYFIVEVILNPKSGYVILDTSSIGIKIKNGDVVKPDSLYFNDAWVAKQEVLDGTSEQLKIDCLGIDSFSIMQSIALVDEVDFVKPTCIILKFPIQPIHPDESFSFYIKKILINNKKQPPIEIFFSKSEESEFSGYRLF